MSEDLKATNARLRELLKEARHFVQWRDGMPGGGAPLLRARIDAEIAPCTPEEDEDETGEALGFTDVGPAETISNAGGGEHTNTQTSEPGTVGLGDSKVASDSATGSSAPAPAEEASSRHAANMPDEATKYELFGFEDGQPCVVRMTRERIHEVYGWECCRAPALHAPVAQAVKYAIATVLDQTIGYFRDYEHGFTTKHPEAQLFDTLPDAVAVVRKESASRALYQRGSEYFKDHTDEEIVKGVDFWIEVVADEAEFRAREDTW